MWSSELLAEHNEKLTCKGAAITSKGIHDCNVPESTRAVFCNTTELTKFMILLLAAFQQASSYKRSTLFTGEIHRLFLSLCCHCIGIVFIFLELGMGMASALSSFNKKSTLLMLTAPVKRIGRIPASWGKHAWSIGREDPRRAVHALKAGTALTLVSLLYILEPFFKGIGKNAMWAVMTVVVVLEFTAGNSH